VILHGATFLVSLSIRRRAGFLSYVLLRGVPIASCLMPGCFCCERPSLYPLLYRGSCGTCCTIISQCLSTEFECCLLIKLVSYDNAAELACGIDRRSSLSLAISIAQQPGTYWYHSHDSGQYPDSLRGPLIVHDPHNPYRGKIGGEIVMTVSDWACSREDTWSFDSEPTTLESFCFTAVSC
jgi:hypothetical protein